MAARALALLLMLLLAAPVSLAEADPSRAATEAWAAEVFGTDAPAAPAEEDWALILINRDHPIPDDWEVGEVVKVRGGKYVARRILGPLQEMFDAARADGLSPVVYSGWRSTERQQELLMERYEKFLGEGCSKEEAREKALEWVAYPGTSEHEAGLGLDINVSSGHKEDIYAWLAENAWKYGFIQRYPEDKVAITGINNEPWHYRYVGRAAAAEMHESGQCLEEYLASRAG